MQNNSSNFGRFHSIIPNLAPGTLEATQTDPSQKIINYTLKSNSNQIQETEINNMSDLPNLEEIQSIKHNWIRVIGLNDVNNLEIIASKYGLNYMAMEDVLALGHRSKVEDYDDYLFLVLQVPSIKSENNFEHLAAFLKQNLLITFEIQQSNVCNLLLDRFKTKKQYYTYKNKSAFLFYNLIDLTVDSFFPLLDKKIVLLDDLEKSLTDGVPSEENLYKLHAVKKHLLSFERLLWPYKDLSASLFQCHILTKIPNFKPYLTDLKDHILQAIDLTGIYQKICDSLNDICQSTIFNRTNDIMKVLTIISTIFMPLSFIASVYGMNFDTALKYNMPELGFKYGYLLVIGFMMTLALSMLLFFRKRKWI